MPDIKNKNYDTKILDCINIVYSFLSEKGESELDARNIVTKITGIKSPELKDSIFKLSDYKKIQEYLTKVNEKSEKQKAKGVFYTPDDLANYMIDKSINFLESESFSKKTEITKKLKDSDFKLLDPTCGTGVFLINYLEYKFSAVKELNEEDVIKIIQNTNGNDIDLNSLLITKLKICLVVMKYFGIKTTAKVASVINKSFHHVNMVNGYIKGKNYDLIIGNPPYVEDSKYDGDINKKYGNIYANVLINASKMLKSDGAISFVIPLSYVATPRMQNLRNALSENLNNQVILSFADRPDCLFPSVHQKLCVLFAKPSEKRSFKTSNYMYWCDSERKTLFDNISVIDNSKVRDKFIPKLGNNRDVKIFNKITLNNYRMQELYSPKNNSLYLNMRATFWIKAFLNPHTGNEYKTLNFTNDKYRYFAYCLLNSSLYWWYWNVVSDCWHITKKELDEFPIPNDIEFGEIEKLANALEKKLESTKKYIGSKQTDYEYKHKLCIKEISAINQYINNVYKLSEKEGTYINNYYIKYRMSGGNLNGN